MSDFDIKPVHEHFEVYRKNGSFVASADTYKEAVDEINAILPEQ